ncbi:DUF5676 family membrane protein [Methylophaga sp. OBS4]|uniref:DUF5676 family membrane protein n=1 Tax=Methylophaga sp. OBS4 TaxID=2991935 RepID=UPI002256727E|nr:DUF5676 family membrane protein [Methylophaga sp. OBS4]MCX4186282.1 DUF5676 family membrane protein [Methylophaga sp. OBS4]
MKLDAIKFGLAWAATFAIGWVICSLLVIALPGSMMQMSGHMLHSDLSGMQWHIGPLVLFYGLIGWTIVAGVTGWLVALIYNKLL